VQLEKRYSINEIRQALHKHLVSPQFTSERAVELYCFINKKWAAIEYDKNGNNPTVLVKEQYK